MRYGRRASALLLLVTLAGCPLDEEAQSLPPVTSVAEDLDQSCELSAQCAPDEYCLDAFCEERDAELEDLPGFAGLETHDGACRVVMLDDYNGIEATLQVEQINEVLFVVTNDVGGDHPWSVEVVLYADGELDIAAGVPEVDLEVLLDKYAIEDKGQLSFATTEGYLCSELDRSLIMFLIMEWFYFG